MRRPFFLLATAVSHGQPDSWLERNVHVRGGQGSAEDVWEVPGRDALEVTSRAEKSRQIWTQRGEPASVSTALQTFYQKPLKKMWLLDEIVGNYRCFFFFFLYKTLSEHVVVHVSQQARYVAALSRW